MYSVDEPGVNKMWSDNTGLHSYKLNKVLINK